MKAEKDAARKAEAAGSALKDGEGSGTDSSDSTSTVTVKDEIAGETPPDGAGQIDPDCLADDDGCVPASRPSVPLHEKKAERMGKCLDALTVNEKDEWGTGLRARTRCVPRWSSRSPRQ